MSDATAVYGKLSALETILNVHCALAEKTGDNIPGWLNTGDWDGEDHYVRHVRCGKKGRKKDVYSLIFSGKDFLVIVNGPKRTVSLKVFADPEGRIATVKIRTARSDDPDAGMVRYRGDPDVEVAPLYLIGHAISARLEVKG